MNKNKTKIFILSLALIGLIFGVSGCLKRKSTFTKENELLKTDQKVSENKPETKKSIIKQNIENAKTDENISINTDIEHWPIYENKDLKYQIKYPNSFIKRDIQIGGNTGLDFYAVNDENLNFYITKDAKIYAPNNNTDMDDTDTVFPDKNKIKTIDDLKNFALEKNKNYTASKIKITRDGNSNIFLLLLNKRLSLVSKDPKNNTYFANCSLIFKTPSGEFITISTRGLEGKLENLPNLQPNEKARSLEENKKIIFEVASTLEFLE